jgi:peptide/nickel transport system substrate-binding protein/oligopeptide transport system substrate-binding protein
MGIAVGIAALVGAGSAGTAGGVPDGMHTAAAARGGTLRIGVPLGRFGPLDPALVRHPDGTQLFYATCALLYNYRDLPAPAGSLAVPEVAKAPPKVSKDGKTNTIVLKRTYRFHTGQRITAASFVAALNRGASPKLGSPARDYLHEFVGADAVIAGRADSISGVTALGRYKLRIRTTRRLSDLVFRLAAPIFCPIAPSTPLRAIDPALGSGPYYIASHVPNRQIVVKRNPFYHGRRRAHVYRIVWRIGLDGEACRAAVDRNEVDYCGFTGVPTGDYAELVRRYGINRKGGRFFSNPELRTDYYAFNHDRPAFAGRGQIPLKKAINLALDRHALVRAVGFPVGRPTDQILPRAIGRDVAIYPVGSVTSASLRKARKLVAKARLSPAKLVLYAFDLPVPAAAARIFKSNLRRIGIEVEVKSFSIDALYDRVSTRGEPYDITQAGIIADYPDGIGVFRYLDGRNIRPKGNGNYAYFNRTRYNRRITAIDRLRGVGRHKAWADLDVELMRTDPPWAPIFNFYRRDFVSKSFGCYVFQPAISRVDLVAACKK